MLIKSQSEVCLHTVHSAHFQPSQFTKPSFSIFQGSGSKTTVEVGMSGYTIYEGSCNLTQLFYYAGFDMLVTSATHLLSLCFRYVTMTFLYSTCNIKV